MRLKLIAVLMSSVLMGPAIAAETDAAVSKLDQAEALAIDAELYARDYGVSEEEAARRLLIMHGAGEEIGQLEQEFGTTLSGVFRQ